MTNARKSAAIGKGLSFPDFCSEWVTIGIFDGPSTSRALKDCLAAAFESRRRGFARQSSVRASTYVLMAATVPATIRLRRYCCWCDEVRPVDAKPASAVKKMAFVFESVGRRVILFALFAAF